jgi:hypothetical protein
MGKHMFLVKQIVFVVLSAISMLCLVLPVYAQDASESANTDSFPERESRDQGTDLYDTETYLQKRAIYQVLKKYNSPLADHTDVFIDACVMYEIDCFLLPAIAGVESSYGHAVIQGSYNPFGWGAGNISFSSWEEGIYAVAEGLHEGYISQGAVTIEQIGSIYATSLSWPSHIHQKRAEFEREKTQLELYFEEISVQ